MPYSFKEKNRINVFIKEHEMQFLYLLNFHLYTLGIQGSSHWLIKLENEWKNKKVRWNGMSRGVWEGVGGRGVWIKCILYLDLGKVLWNGL